MYFQLDRRGRDIGLCHVLTGRPGVRTRWPMITGVVLKTLLNQSGECRQRIFSVAAFGFYGQLRATLGDQSQDAENAFAIHAFSVFNDLYACLETTRGTHEQISRPRVQPLLILDHDRFAGDNFTHEYWW